MHLAEHVFKRLRECQVDCTFGIPGDFILPLYAAQAEAGMRTIVCTHEPGAAFAADAYARLRGLGVVLVTYGAGALNVVNAAAMSYAEHTPLLVISGAPETTQRGPDVYIHHRVKSFESQLRIFREITIEAACIDDPATAGSKIDRVIGAVIRHKRPGYLEIPRDLVNACIAPTETPLAAIHDAPVVDPAALNEVVAEIIERLEVADRPALYVGVGVRRYNVAAEAVRLAERWALPVVSSVMGKASFPESHSQFAGIYMGALGDQTARSTLEDSDCVLTLGVIQSDVNTGFWTSQLDSNRQIQTNDDSVTIGYHRYDGIPFSSIVSMLAKHRPSQSRRFAPRPKKCDLPCRTAGSLETADVIAQVRMLDQSKYTFVADVGDAWFVGLELRTDIFLAPGYYATMGFAVPGALGSGIAQPNRRPFVLVGDGAFQMTGCELATLATQNLRPIVLLLNNSSYMMLESLDRSRPYYALRSWDYVGFARTLGCSGERVATAEELNAALRRAEAADRPYLIEAVLNKDDLSPVMRRIRDHVMAARAVTIPLCP